MGMAMLGVMLVLTALADKLLYAVTGTPAFYSRIKNIPPCRI